MAPTRRPDSPPILKIDVSPAYELLQSIAVTFAEHDGDTYEVGDAWLAEARERAGEDLIGRIDEVMLGENDTFVHLTGLVYDTPAPRDVPAFLAHLRETDADEIRLHLVQFYARDTRRSTPPGIIRAAVGGDPDARREFLATSHPECEPWTT
jgi:hypothetical protein